MTCTFAVCIASIYMFSIMRIKKWGHNRRQNQLNSTWYSTHLQIIIFNKNIVDAHLFLSVSHDKQQTTTTATGKKNVLFIFFLETHGVCVQRSRRQTTIATDNEQIEVGGVLIQIASTESPCPWRNLHHNVCDKNIFTFVSYEAKYCCYFRIF